MFERFTIRAQEVVDEAKAASEEMGQSYVGTEHLLLGMLRADDNVAGSLLLSHGVTEEKLKTLIEQLITGSESVGVSDAGGFSPRAYRVLQMSYLEARRLKCSLVGTEHILIAMLKVYDCAGPRLLAEVYPRHPHRSFRNHGYKHGAFQHGRHYPPTLQSPRDCIHPTLRNNIKKH